MHWHRGLNPFWPHMFGLKPLLGLEPMAPIRPQLLVSHVNHSATETSIKRMFNEPMIYVVTIVGRYVDRYVGRYVCVCMYVCIMYVCVYVCVYVSVCMYV